MLQKLRKYFRKREIDLLSDFSLPCGSIDLKSSGSDQMNLT